MITTLVNVNVTKKYDVYIGRGTMWGNPYIIGVDGSREQVCALYRQHVLESPHLIENLGLLRGRVLGCHCTPKLCHGDILIELIMRYCV